MPLTKNQKILYGSTWNTTKKALAERGFDREEIEQERNAILKLSGAKQDAKGRYSGSTLSNSGLSTFLDLCETTVSGKENQKRRSRSIIYSIEKLGLDEAYLDHICRDQFKIEGWRTLSVNRLAVFIITARNRAKERCS